MAITKETAKKTAKEKSLNRPRALRNGSASPALPGGGVCGNVRLKTPSINDNRAASGKGLARAGQFKLTLIQSKPVTSKLVTIQPTVPSTRKPAKSRLPSGTLAKVMELA